MLKDFLFSPENVFRDCSSYGETKVFYIFYSLFDDDVKPYVVVIADFNIFSFGKENFFSVNLEVIGSN